MIRLARPEALPATAVREAVFEWADPIRSDRAERAPKIRTRAVVPASGQAVLVERERLDGWLLERAEEAGARIFRQRVRRVRRAGAGALGWVAESDDGGLCAPILVGADGCHSVVRAAVVGRFQASEVAFGATVRPAWPDVPEDVGRPGRLRAVFFDRMARPYRHGYAYAFGGSERPIIGAWGRTGGRTVVALLRHLLAGGWIAEGAREKYRSRGRSSPCWVSAAAFDRPTAGDGWLLVGDAAGHVYPVTGEGIRYALRGGRLAAEAILDGSPRSYRDRWEADFGRILRRGARLVGAYERSGVFRRGIERSATSARFSRVLADLVFAGGSHGRFYASVLVRGTVFAGLVRGLWHMLRE